MPSVMGVNVVKINARAFALGAALAALAGALLAWASISCPILLRGSCRRRWQRRGCGGGQWHHRRPRDGTFLPDAAHHCAGAGLGPCHRHPAFQTIPLPACRSSATGVTICGFGSRSKNRSEDLHMSIRSMGQISGSQAKRRQMSSPH
ncbi:hypothetical protein ACCS93_34950 [Rhizobium ruizarguesonis]